MYHLHTDNRSISSDEIIAHLDPSMPLHLAHINRIRELERDGARYSNEDFDVLSRAHGVIVRGEREPTNITAAWVRHMTGAAA